MIGLQRARSRVAPGQEISPGRGAVWPCSVDCPSCQRHGCQDQRKNAEEMLLPKILRSSWFTLIFWNWFPIKWIACLHCCLQPDQLSYYVRPFSASALCWGYTCCMQQFLLQFIWHSNGFLLRFKVIGEAYEVLTDPTKKELYEKGSDGIRWISLSLYKYTQYYTV